MAALGDAWNAEVAKAAPTGAKIPAQRALLAIFKDNYALGASPGGEPYVVDKAVPGIAIPLDGAVSLRDRLASHLYNLLDMTTSDTTLGAVMGIIRGEAGTMPKARPHLRTARTSDNRIAIDLGRDDGAVVLCSPQGWMITQGVALFRRSAFNVELPLPSRTPEGAGPALALVNLRDWDAKAVYCACRIMACMPDVTLPAEIFTGQPGTAKTRTTEMTVAWLGGFMAQMPKDPKDWAALASNTHCIGHDNISGLSHYQSDLICRAASGDSYASRKLYKDAELFAMRFDPVSVVINTVEMSIRGDLVRRAAVHELMPPDRYLGDAELDAAWSAAHPAALGWLFDMVCRVMAMLPNITAPGGETMPDFARVLTACDAMWGTQALSAWKEGQSRSYSELVDDDVVSWLITERITAPWQGTSRELMTFLMLPQLAGREWTPRLVSSRLDRCTAALTANGWTVRRPLDTHTKSRRILLVPPSRFIQDGVNSSAWVQNVPPQI
jgi:hypothetical protein